MAQQKKGILDGFSGSIANITGYKLRGNSIIKSKNRAGIKTFSDSQLACQSAFKKYSTFVHDLYWQVVKPFHQVPNFSAVDYGVFREMMFKLYKDKKLSYPNDIEMTAGQLPDADLSYIYRLGPPYRFQLVWQKVPPEENYSQYDQMFMLVMNLDRTEFEWEKIPAYRGSNGYLWHFPLTWLVNERIVCYWWLHKQNQPTIFSYSNKVYFLISGGGGG